MSDYKQRAMMAAHLLHNEARYILGMGDKYRIGIVAGHIGRILEGSRPIDAYVAALAWQDVARSDIGAAVADIAADRWSATSLVGRLLAYHIDSEEQRRRSPDDAGLGLLCDGKRLAMRHVLSMLGVEVPR